LSEKSYNNLARDTPEGTNMTQSEVITTAITVILATGGAYVALKVTVATLVANIKNNTEKQSEVKHALVELEKRVREIEVGDGKTAAYMKTVFKSIDSLTDKIDEWNR